MHDVVNFVIVKSPYIHWVLNEINTIWEVYALQVEYVTEVVRLVLCIVGILVKVKYPKAIVVCFLKTHLNHEFFLYLNINVDGMKPVNICF